MIDSLIHRSLRGETSRRAPFWFMRQAGRYLPEYREIRAGVKDFLSLCYNPELAAEVTIQPIRHFGMDAAIVFSDILVVPHAMGQPVSFIPGDGPKLEAIRDEARIAQLKSDRQTITSFLDPVARTLRRVRQELPAQTALIGFCGAPWTVACYMVEGKTSRDYEAARRFALEQPVAFAELIRRVTDASIEYLTMQIEAGAGVIQIFDSWAGILPEAGFRKWVIEPTLRITAAIRLRHPDVPIIGFPRGCGAMLKEYAEKTGVDGVSIDVFMPTEWARQQTSLPIQGHLDPLLLATDLPGALAETDRILKAWEGTPFIFNLGHGMLPFTPLAHVEALCRRLKGEEA